MNYYVEAIQTDDNDFLWCVIESKTDQLIDSFEFEDEALDYSEFLNAGGGFAGDTPRFMLTRVAPTDINRVFTEVFS